MLLELVNEIIGTRLVGEVKNLSGIPDKEFVLAVEKLMDEYKVNYVQLYWDHWFEEVKE